MRCIADPAILRPFPSPDNTFPMRGNQRTRQSIKGCEGSGRGCGDSVNGTTVGSRSEKLERCVVLLGLRSSTF